MYNYIVNKYIEEIFSNKTCSSDDLISFGFRTKDNNIFEYTSKIEETNFKVVFTYDFKNKLINAVVFDMDNTEEYTLYLASGANGKLVNLIRDSYVSILKEISNKCFHNESNDKAMFYIESIKEYIDEKFGDKAEYLFKKDEDTFIARSNLNDKWYLVVMKIKRRKLQVNTVLNDDIFVLDLKGSKEWMDANVDNRKFFKGYHMNKKCWFTAVLDGSVAIDEIKQLIDISYELVKKKL